MEEKVLKGRGLLKVTGILMIIFAGISIVVSIIALAAVAFVIAAGFGTALLYFASILMIVSAAAELIAGILGVKNCAKQEKAGTCLGWGVIIILLAVIASILTVVGGNDFPVVSFLIGLVLPVLYIIGAVQNKNS